MLPSNTEFSAYLFNKKELTKKKKKKKRKEREEKWDTNLKNINTIIFKHSNRNWNLRQGEYKKKVIEKGRRLKDKRGKKTVTTLRASRNS